MSDDQFNKLFKYMQGMETRLDAKIEAVRDELKGDVQRLISLIDADLARRATDEQERLLMNRQLDRHEAWIERAASRLNVTYEHEGRA